MRAGGCQRRHCEPRHHQAGLAGSGHRRLAADLPHLGQQRRARRIEQCRRDRRAAGQRDVRLRGVHRRRLLWNHDRHLHAEFDRERRRHNYQHRRHAERRGTALEYGNCLGERHRPRLRQQLGDSSDDRAGCRTRQLRRHQYGEQRRSDRCVRRFSTRTRGLARTSITFSIPGAGVRTISTPPLPAITDTVMIDGTTQPDFTGTPIIELTGADTPPGSNGLVVNAADSVIRGLIINRWPGSGIVLQGPAGNAVVGNWIGTASDGTTAAGNGNGVLVQTSGHLIGGSTPGRAQRHLGQHDRREHRIHVGPRQRGRRQLHRDGSDRDARRRQCAGRGAHLRRQANTIGGLGSGIGNVISGNNQAGVVLDGGATANTVDGNAIGTDATRTNAVPNGIGISVGAGGGASSNIDRRHARGARQPDRIQHALRA